MPNSPKKIDIIFWGSIITFLASGLASTKIIAQTETIESLLQALAVTILIIVIVSKFVMKKLVETNPNLAYFIQFSPLTLFVYLLVFSTGGLASPFLILTHLFAIGMAFLISPGVSMVYVLTTAFYLVLNIRQDLTAQSLIAESPFAVVLYALAYGAILPFSQYIAKIYKQKDIWVRELSGMLVTTKKEEENLLKNIDDAVIMVSPDAIITFANQAIWEKTYFRQADLVGKKLSVALKFKDSKGKIINAATLPIKAVIETKSEAKIDKMQINTRDGNFIPVDFKFLPINESDGAVSGVIIIIKDSNFKQQAPKPGQSQEQKKI